MKKKYSLKFSTLSDYRRFFSFGYKTRYSTITIKVGPYQFKSPSLKIIKDFNEDEKRVEKILDLCFIQNQVMWQDLSYEAYYYYMKSLERFNQACKLEISTMSSSLRESDQFYVGMLKQMSANGMESLNRVKELSKLSSISKGLKYMQPNLKLIEENANLRKSTYSMFRYLIDILPEGNKTKQRSLAYLHAGEKVLTRIYGLKPAEIGEPEMILA